MQVTQPTLFPVATVDNGKVSDRWYSPASLIHKARQVFNGQQFDLDPASCEMANIIVAAKRIYTIENDGLSKEWNGFTWLNPPYSDPSPFIEKFISDRCYGYILTNTDNGVQWWQTAYNACDAIALFKKRIRFIPGEGNTSSGTGTRSQTLFFFGDSDRIVKSPTFEEEFNDVANILIRN